MSEVAGMEGLEDEGKPPRQQWKNSSDDSIWVALDFPRVCVETMIPSKNCESLDPVFRSDMFSCLLENARRKLEEAITGSCKKPCCYLDSRKKQAKRELEAIQQGGGYWDATMSGLGFKGFSQELRMIEGDGVQIDNDGDDAAGNFDKNVDTAADGSSSSSSLFFTTSASPSPWSSGDGGIGKDDRFVVGESSSAAAAGAAAPPHEGLFYVLPYLLLKDLLSVEQACRSLREAVSCDSLLWQHLKIDHSLNTKLTDEALLKLTARSQGRLQSLMLVECLRISDEALEQVVASSPMLSRIFLPGCIRISVDAVVRMVEYLEQGRSQGLGVKQIKIRGLSGVTKDNLDRLQSLLGVDESQPNSQKPHYYLSGDASTSYIDERAIDVEACPRCKQPRAVFDCTRDRCREWKTLKIPECRGCIFCISRCEDCGMCIDDTDYEETFCLRLLCSDCWLRLPKCLECNRPGCESSSDYFIRRPDAIFVCPDCQGAYRNGAGLEFYVV